MKTPTVERMLKMNVIGWLIALLIIAGLMEYPVATFLVVLAIYLALIVDVLLEQPI